MFCTFNFAHEWAIVFIFCGATGGPCVSVLAPTVIKFSSGTPTMINCCCCWWWWIPGLDFGALGMCSSHWKVVKGVIQPRTWENGPFGGVCDLVHTQKDELSQSKHMGLTIYTKENINLASYGQDHADVGARGGKPVLGPK